MTVAQLICELIRVPMDTEIVMDIRGSEDSHGEDLIGIQPVVAWKSSSGYWFEGTPNYEDHGPVRAEVVVNFVRGIKR